MTSSNGYADMAGIMAGTLDQCLTPLTSAFFSRENINAIQIQLRDKVKCVSGLSIDRQDDNTLLIIMRSIYAIHTQNTNSSTPAVQAEVVRLNALVLLEIVPMALSNLAAYLGYVRDASTLPVPIDRGINTSRKGTASFSLFQN